MQNDECRIQSRIGNTGCFNRCANQRRLSQLASGPSVREGWQALGVGPQRIQEMPKAILDHVGVAIADLEKALNFYRDALGLDVEIPEEVASQRVRAHFLRAGEGAIELLEATTADSAIAKYLGKRGPGLHHIALRVDDIVAVLAELKARGVQLIDERPRPGAHGSLVAFIHPASAHGVLVELTQRS